MSELGHSLPICFVLASYNVCSTPKADIRFQRNIRRDGPQAGMDRMAPRQELHFNCARVNARLSPLENLELHALPRMPAGPRASRSRR